MCVHGRQRRTNPTPNIEDGLRLRTANDTKGYLFRMLLLSKSIAGAIVFAICIGSAFGDTEKVEWFQNRRPDFALIEFANSQLIVRYRPLSGGEVSGLAFVVDGQLISASHIYSQIKIGDEVEIGRHNGVGSKIDWSKATLVSVSPIDDLAKLNPREHGVLANNDLPFCQQGARSGALLEATKFRTEGTYILSSSSAAAVNTSLKILPRVNEFANQTLQPGQISLLAMAGQNRLVAAGNATGGHSGGALFDVTRRCVVGVSGAQAA